MISFPWREPPADGLNWIATAQRSPTPSVDWQVVSCESIEKSALSWIVMLLMVAGPLFHHGLKSTAKTVLPRLPTRHEPKSSSGGMT